MRLRIPEVFGGRTAYQVAAASGGMLDEGSVYALWRKQGRVKFVSLAMMQALCDVLEVEPNELLEYERRPVKRPVAKRKTRG